MFDEKERDGERSSTNNNSMATMWLYFILLCSLTLLALKHAGHLRSTRGIYFTPATAPFFPLLSRLPPPPVFLCNATNPPERHTVDDLLDEHTRLVADFQWGDESQPWMYPRKLSDDMIQSLPPYVILTVDTLFLPNFFREIHPKIVTPYILVTGAGDNSPYSQIGRNRTLLNDILRGDSTIVRWYAMNYDFPPLPPSNTAFFPLPIGLTHWPHHDVRKELRTICKIALDHMYRDVRPHHKDIWVLTSFTNRFDGPYPQSRESALQLAAETPSLFHTPNTTQLPGFREYLRLVLRSRFVLSPPGRGLDCHRTYEALYLGAYPIVLKTPLSPLYSGLPVLVVSRWEEISEELLERTYALFRRNHLGFEWDRLWKSFHFGQIADAQRDFRSKLPSR